MANRATITYNSKTISTEDRDGSFSVTYNGKTLATIGAGASKTLNCSGKVMATNVVVGGKTLNCAGKLMATNVVVSVASLVDSVLANNSWATISAISRAGQASQYWKVGDTKPFTCNGTTYTAQIIAFDHDDVTSSASYGRNKVGITFQFKEAFATETKFHSSEVYGSYDTKDIHTSFIPNNILNKMESALVAVLVGATKQIPNNSSFSDNSLKTITNQKILLASCREIKGSPTSGSGSTDGTQYAFYAAGNSAAKCKPNLTATSVWWTRTPFMDSSARVINKTGSNTTREISADAAVAPIFFV